MAIESQVMEIYENHKKTTALLESLIAELKLAPSTRPGDSFRVFPGGPLNEHGVAELKKLFEAGLSSSEIALRMDISLSGIAKRRGQWRRGKPLKAFQIA